jgi:hypothetical protein
MADGRSGRRADQPGEIIDRAGVRQSPADDENGGDGDGRRMPEAGESLLARHDSQDHGRDQGDEGHHVMAPAAPDEEGENRREKDENDDLLGGHGAQATPPSRRQEVSLRPARSWRPRIARS